MVSDNVVMTAIVAVVAIVALVLGKVLSVKSTHDGIRIDFAKRERRLVSRRFRLKGKKNLQRCCHSLQKRA